MRLAVTIAAVRLLCVTVVALGGGAVLATGAVAAPSGPGWEISSVAHPTNFSMEDNATCVSPSYPICDEYVVTLTNVGGGPTTEPVTIADTVPQGLKPRHMLGENLEPAPGYKENGFGWACSAVITTCTYSDVVQPGATLAVVVELEVTSARGVVTNAVKVTGGGVAPIATSKPLTLSNTVEGPPGAFGIAAVGFAARDASGLVDTLAGDHPYGLTTTVNLNTNIETSAGGEHTFADVEPVKDLAVYLPLGFLGDPTAAARCTELQLIAKGGRFETECPPDSRVGTVVLFAESAVLSSLEPANQAVVSAVYNMVPDDGYPAQFGFKVFGKAAPLYASVVRTPAGYALRVAAPGIPRAINFEGAALTFFGDPNAADGEPSSPQAFFTNPEDCSVNPLTTRVEVDPWSAPGHWSSAETVAYPQIAGCDLLQFEPTVELHPEVTQAEAPSGYEIDIKVPQNLDRFPLLATPQLKNVTMTLPAGMTLSPGGGDGLTGCPATGPQGIDMPTGGGTPSEAGEGEAIGADGMTHLVAGHCPLSSQIGTVKIATPVLESPLEGHVYVAQPQCGGQGQAECTTADATDGNLFGLYLEAEGSGVVVKLAGSVSADPATGQLTARFRENPQLPFSELSLHLKGGGRAPLANPRQCGATSAGADLVPWSAPVTPDAVVSSSAFSVSWDGSGGACPATLPFTPGVTGGVTNVVAGHFSPFTLTVTRGDRQQDLARLQVKMPAGLLGMLSKVTLCGEPQAQQGTCGEASQVGTTSIEVGPGSQPLGVKGRVYLTGPYKGAPFGLSVVVPAVAGPFNLGDVVVRARIDIDPETSAITVTSDPLPQVLDGVPLRIQTLNVAVEREGFMFNPTSCTAKQIATTVEAEQGASASLSTPFAVEGCKALPFSPKFSVSTQARTSKKNGASLDVKVASGPGQANIGKVVVSLPKQLPARLTTLQKACTEATFAQNPAMCPAASDVGTAKAVTPVLGEPVTGPAYLVSRGGAAFPNLVVILEGQGIRLDLVGNTDIKKSITTSTFDSVPDAPISSFELKLPEGPHSVLASNLSAKAEGSLCGVKLVMPTTITGQNGAQVKQTTKIAVTGCPKAKKATKGGARSNRR